MYFKNQNMFKLFIISVFGLVLASNDIKDEGDKGAHSDRGSLWFGPRLGKRSLSLSSEDDRQKFFRLLEAADTLKFYYDQLPYYQKQADEPETKVTKKVIFTPKLGRSIGDIYQEKRTYENVEFTPRLGRRLSDDMPATPKDQEMYHQDPEQVDTRTRYFSPRLGRTITFSPRLGRELSYDYPINVRVARSTNATAN
uniref:Diapause hormone-phermone biosynthesis activating neuropeptide n=1 Tax=Antheraea pernyi TaxID=7119 RepID=Q6SYA3_ANTPE|nr:diapause hormone-phermone biosynthesis activating neuropeptide [Antheraea pernyi]